MFFIHNSLQNNIQIYNITVLSISIQIINLFYSLFFIIRKNTNFPIEKVDSLTLIPNMTEYIRNTFFIESIEPKLFRIVVQQVQESFSKMNRIHIKRTIGQKSHRIRKNHVRVVCKEISLFLNQILSMLFRQNEGLQILLYFFNIYFFFKKLSILFQIISENFHIQILHVFESFYYVVIIIVESVVFISIEYMDILGSIYIHIIDVFKIFKSLKERIFFAITLQINYFIAYIGTTTHTVVLNLNFLFICFYCFFFFFTYRCIWLI